MRLLLLVALLSLCPVALASSNEARFVVAGYRQAVMHRLIKPNSSYSLALQRAITLIQQGATVQSAAFQIGVNVAALQKLIELGTPIPTIEAVIPSTKPPVVAANPVIHKAKADKPKKITALRFQGSNPIETEESDLVFSSDSFAKFPKLSTKHAEILPARIADLIYVRVMEPLRYETEKGQFNTQTPYQSRAEFQTARD